MAGKLIIHLTIVSIIKTICVTAWQNDKVSIQIFTGTIFDPTRLIPYESSIPLIFQIPINLNLTNITNFENQRPCQQDRRSKACKIEENLKFILDQIKRQLLLEQTSWKTEEFREKDKRSISHFLGSTFNWCCQLVTESQLAGVIENERDITNSYNNLVDLANQDHENILLTAHHLNNLSSNIHNMSDRIHDNINHLQTEINSLKTNPEITNQLYITVQTILKYQYLNFFHDNLRDIKTKCLENKIPKSIIDEETLVKELTSIQNILGKSNQKLAIDYNQNLQAYYKLPITTCAMSQSKITVKLQLPVNFKDRMYKAYTNIPIPLLWMNQTCYVTKKGIKLLATDINVYVMDQLDDGCNSKTEPLCLLPRKMSTHEEDHNCINEVLKSASIPQLKKKCQFICQDTNDEPIITQLLPNKVLITNTKQELILNCPERNQSKTLPKNKNGALEILIPCDCQIQKKSGQIIL